MKTKNYIITKSYHFPCGELILGSFDGKLCLCDWTDGMHNNKVNYRLQRILKALFIDGTDDVVEMARQQLNEYFRNKRREFDLPLLFVGTDFQKKVWDELSKIPYGTTVSYGDIASRLGDPKKVRAVANASAVNALSIVVPCHRVIGGDGSMTGYNGGLEKKRYLLDMEQY